MKRDMDDLLKQALSPEVRPDSRLNQRILEQRKENLNMENLNMERNMERNTGRGTGIDRCG